MDDGLDFEEVSSGWDDDDLAAGAHRRRRWVRATSLVLAVALVLSTVGTVALVLLRRASRVSCDTAALADVDLVGTTLVEARRTLGRGPYRCEGDVAVGLVVTELVVCDRDRPGTIVRTGTLAYDVDGRPYVAVTVCSSAIAA